MIAAMASSSQISSQIVRQLTGQEKRLLSLVVAVRNSLGSSVKGDLSSMVKSSLRKLIASGAVTDADGLYSLARQR